VGLRINPCLRASRFDFTLATGTRRSRTGFRRQDREWFEALRFLSGDPHLCMRGLHFHIGSGICKADPYIDALKMVLEMAGDLLDVGLRMPLLNMGGGFGIPTLKAFRLLEAVRFFGWGRPPRPVGGRTASLLADIAVAYSKSLRQFARIRGIEVPVLCLEPGRALVSSAQLLLLRVASVKKKEGGHAVAVCDSGAMSLSPLLWSECHRVLPVRMPESGASGIYDIVGNMPAPLDLVALQQELPDLKPGDILAITDTGAYFTSLGNNFGGPRPAILWIENGEPRLIRTRESFDEMTSRDLF
jgi:diaminopimelate decarboxylase